MRPLLSQATGLSVQAFSLTLSKSYASLACVVTSETGPLLLGVSSGFCCSARGKLIESLILSSYEQLFLMHIPREKRVTIKEGDRIIASCSPKELVDLTREAGIDPSFTVDLLAELLDKGYGQLTLGDPTGLVFRESASAETGQ